MKPGSRTTTEIESLAYRGEGIGHVENKVIFVPFTAPGDLAEVVISENKRNYLRGTLEHLKSRSPHRVVPICDYFGLCGGCHWQHLSYQSQLDAKENILKETLSRLGKIGPDSYECQPTVASLNPFGYRSRVRLQCLTHRRTVTGFFRAQSNEIVPIDHCDLLPGFSNSVLKKLGDFLNSMDHFFPFPEVEILTNPAAEEATLSFTTPSLVGDESVKEFLKALKVQIPQVYGVSIETTGEDGSKIEHFGNCSLLFPFSFTPRSEKEPVSLKMKNRIHTFSQVNIEQNLNLMRTIWEWGEPSGEKKVVDLFCGVGNLSLPLAARAKTVIGLENNPLSINDARSNAQLNGFPNCDYRLADVYSDLNAMDDLKDADLLIVDPPRKGVKEYIANVASLNPKKILYVSCNPSTLARDASLFCYSRYRLKRIQLLDMFPQTYHIESVAEFIPDKQG